MRRISSDYAAEHLSELLHDVEAGEEFEITIEGRAVARLLAARTPTVGHDDTDTPSEEVEQAFHGD